MKYKEKNFGLLYAILFSIFYIFLFSFSFLVLIPGDLGSAEGDPLDGCVNFEDLMIFILAYSSTPSDAT